jgi:hypothetical protein
MRERIEDLREQLVEEREARRRAGTIIAQLSRANAEQARTIQSIEAPATPEPPEPQEEPETSPVHPERAEPAEPAETQREEPERVPPERVEPERTEPQNRLRAPVRHRSLGTTRRGGAGNSQAGNACGMREPRPQERRPGKGR